MSLKKIKKNQGQVMLIVVVLFLVVSMIIILGVINPTLKNIRIVSDLYKTKKSFYLSDSGVADAVYRTKNNMAFFGQQFLPLDNDVATIDIVDTSDGQTITAEGNYADYIRNIEVKVTQGAFIPFYYGVEVGNGGFSMSGNSQVNGGVSSNGPITGGTITGSAISTGSTGSISGTNIGENGVGNAHAHTVTDSVVEGLLKCKEGSHNNKSCNTSYADPGPVLMPISAEQIAEWKAEAEASRVINGNYSPTDPVTLGPVKITGNFDVKNNVTMTGVIWVEGVLSFKNSQAKIVLATSTYGDKSGVIIVDKYTDFSGGSQILSTGIPGSYVMLLVTSDCPVSSFCNNKNAISASGNAGSVVLVAPYGTISFGGDSSAREAVAHEIVMSGSVTIDYDPDLMSLSFPSGPAGGFHIINFREI